MYYLKMSLFFFSYFWYILQISIEYQLIYQVLQYSSLGKTSSKTSDVTKSPDNNIYISFKVY